MAVIYLVEGGPSAASMIKSLLVLAGPSRQSEVSYGTLPNRVTVPDDIYERYYHPEISADSSRDQGIEAEEAGVKGREDAPKSAPPRGVELKPVGRVARKTTERRVGR